MVQRGRPCDLPRIKDARCKAANKQRPKNFLVNLCLFLRFSLLFPFLAGRVKPLESRAYKCTEYPGQKRHNPSDPVHRNPSPKIPHEHDLILKANSTAHARLGGPPSIAPTSPVAASAESPGGVAAP